MDKFTLYNDDCLNVLRTMEDNSIDSCVTDPPYGIAFMGKEWDNFSTSKNSALGKKSPANEKSKEFPTRGKPIGGWSDEDRQAAYNFEKWCEDWSGEVLRVLKPGGFLLSFCSPRMYHRMTCGIEDAGFQIRDQIMWMYGSGFPKSHNIGDGWGTALKPAHEPIVVARKPIIKMSVAKNKEIYGTGAINIDGCRVEYSEDNPPIPQLAHGKTKVNSKKTMFDGPSMNKSSTEATIGGNLSGRWPANVIHDGSDEVVSNFPDRKTTWVSDKHANNRNGEFLGKLKHPGNQGFNDSGSAARFFYCAKASKSDKDEGLDSFLAKKAVYFQTGGGASGKPSSLSAGRNTEYKNIHPTVKPTDLMKYLCRLVTPKGGIVLDPFMGSGSTGKAAIQEGFRFCGIEMSDEYFEIAKARIEHAANGKICNLEDFFA